MRQEENKQRHTNDPKTRASSCAHSWTNVVLPPVPPVAAFGQQQYAWAATQEPPRAAGKGMEKSSVGRWSYLLLTTTTYYLLLTTAATCLLESNTPFERTMAYYLLLTTYYLLLIAYY